MVTRTPAVPRGQVLIKDTGVYLCTHWGINSLVHDAGVALSRKMHWRYPTYLTRIIYDTMAKRYYGGDSGLGIGTKKRADVKLLILVHCKRQLIIINSETGQSTLTFEDFIKQREKML
jgi:hypothetical protein